MIIHPLKKTQIVSILFIYLLTPLPPLVAFESIDYIVIDKLIKGCYENTKLCNKVLFKINNYQKNVAKNKNFSCQTRLLGLEANLIMAMNYNLKRKDAKSMIQDLKKYC